MKNEIIGVAQYFYHCNGEYLPIRDIPNRSGNGFKTEPHYENLTENWCSECMNSRIKSANKNFLEYLFLITKYRNSDFKMDGKLIVVGYLKRAEKKRWIELSKDIPSGVQGFLPDPSDCGFFAGDPKSSKFVSVEDGFELKNVKNGRYIWYINENLGRNIIKKLNSSENIYYKLIRRVKELEKEKNKNPLKKRGC